MNTANYTVLIYDSSCALCSWAVRLVLAIDKKDRIRLSSQQTPFAKEVIAWSSINANSTVIAVKGNQIKSKSAAILLTLHEIGGVWSLVSKLMKLIPPELLDKMYDLIAKNRTKFGNQTSCIAVKPKYKHKFLM
ncbi:MAG: DUF393 domain-containing protein [Bacteroidales bacterium]|nr:DUF393 domain-containing protein [Bacteroidales bacterium]MBN2750489.1 DUF393 domain-containing protein [Bacteroidales bacterium]